MDDQAPLLSPATGSTAMGADRAKQHEPPPPALFLLAGFSALGGFLFGYDTGVISGAMILIRLLRQASIILSASMVFTVGGGDGRGSEKTTLLIGRIIVGIGIGFASMAVPVYLSESAPVELRGRLTVTNTLFITGGQTVAGIVCGSFATTSHGWRYYSASIITMAGVSDEATAIWLAAATSTMNFLGTFIGLWLVERVGRRPLILGSLLGVIGSLFLLGMSFQMAYTHSPGVQMPGHDIECQVDTCGICTSLSACGFCFHGEVDDVNNSSCVAANHSTYDQMSTSGLCSNSTLLDSGEITFAYDWCPYEYAWMSVLVLGLYLLFFSPGMGPMPWTLNSEIFPGWARATCTSLTTSVNWASNLLVSLTFLTLTEILLKYGAFYFYMGLATLGLVTLYTLLPETRGVPLEEIESLFSGPLLAGLKRRR
ncbi:Proton myo-inositol cotransporter-like 2 [Homarus americanus]|uniref:Proton myo-inositol cotransporter-like 2 n=1 Tax=Homarus americanus TaxID=6706 RepID=A0A8J5KFQ8_HOMAM|nr:Proton myo-inositol cotransporter-like 2 [Homarus americanus]